MDHRKQPEKIDHRKQCKELIKTLIRLCDTKLIPEDERSRVFMQTLMATENCDGITGNLEHVRNVWMCDGAGASKVVIANNKLPYHENVAFKERVDRWFPWTRRELVAALPLGDLTIFFSLCDIFVVQVRKPITNSFTNVDFLMKNSDWAKEGVKGVRLNRFAVIARKSAGARPDRHNLRVAVEVEVERDVQRSSDRLDRRGKTSHNAVSFAIWDAGNNLLRPDGHIEAPRL